MEIAGPILLGCASFANAMYTYVLSTRIKSDEEKIKQGGEQLNRILKEYDSHMKYIYNLQVVCNDYRLAWNDMYSRQFLKTKGDVVVRNQYVLLRNRIDDELYEEINGYIQSWKSNGIEFMKQENGNEEYRLKIIENLLKENNIKYEIIKAPK